MRRIAVFAYSFSAAVFISVCLLSAKLALAAGLAVLLLLPLCLCRPLRRLRAGWLLCLGLALGLIWSAAWTHSQHKRSEALIREACCVEATVLDYPKKTAYGQSVEIGVNKLRCRLYYALEPTLEAGQRIRVTASFQLTADRTEGDHALAQGLALYGYAQDTPVLLGSAAHSWRYFPAKLGFRLRQNIGRAFDGDTAPFLTAVLTGDRTQLRDDIFFYAMLRESGVAHCVAVSGMHLSFLVAFLYVILGKGRLSALVCIPVIVLFMAMTGFTPSVVRAGVMQLAVCCATLSRREYDSRTALALALALLLAINPYSVKNVGLQLSFASTLGILLFYEPLRRALPQVPAKWKRRGLPARALRFVLASLAMSLSAMIFTTPITAVVFDQVPLLSPLTNLLTLWAVSLAFSLGLMAALLGFLHLPAAILLGYPARWLVAYIRFVVAGVGRVPFAALSPSGLYIGLWLAFSYLLLPVFRILPLRRRLPAYWLSVLAMLAVYWGLGSWEASQDTLRTAVLDVGQGQCVVVTSRDHTLVLDCGGSRSDNAGDLAVRYLHSLGRTRVDALVLSHYHLDHANGALELMRRLRVDELYAPGPPAGDADSTAILRNAEAMGVKVTLLTDEIHTSAYGDLSLTLTPPLGGKGDNEQCLAALCQVDTYQLLLTGDLDSGSEYRLLERLALPDTELLIAGHHGSKGSVSQRLLDRAAPDAVVVSVGRNRHGLPANETLLRMEDSGAHIYRTDQSGTIIVSYQK